MSFKVLFKGRVSYIKIMPDTSKPIAQCSISTKDLDNWISIQAKFFRNTAEKFIDNIEDGDWIEGEGKLIPQVKDKSRVDLMVFSFEKSSVQSSNEPVDSKQDESKPSKPKYQPRKQKEEPQPEKTDFIINEDDLPF